MRNELKEGKKRRRRTEKNSRMKWSVDHLYFVPFLRHSLMRPRLYNKSIAATAHHFQPSHQLLQPQQPSATVPEAMSVGEAVKLR